MAKKNSYSKEVFFELFIKSDIILSKCQLESLYEFHHLVRSFNNKYDLVRTINFKNLVQKHYIDCCYIARYVDFEPPLLDIGTGAGFPGIPLKIMFPEKEMILAEKRLKRIEFLDMAIRRLGLERINTYPHSINYNSLVSCRSVITRAVESIEKTLARTDSLLPQKARVFFMKGPNVGAEIKQRFGSFILQERIDYRIPGTSLSRSLIIYSKSKEII